VPKPKKERLVKYPPHVVLFKPQGIPAYMLEQVVVTVDEYEAVRLMDFEGLDQEEAAKRMGVSRATGARIMESAHKKIAEALTQGKAIRIEGGSYVIQMDRYWCQGCGEYWEMKERANASQCPSCGSREFVDLKTKLAGLGRRRWQGRGRGRRI
jgi:predicted DNA-binding protein (UPF0251 family)/DNA-directed RNA polymerase subunit RPC12/RpoP